MASSTKQNYTSIAKRWANALMELANEDANVSKDAILKDLKEITNTFKSSQELINVINNPSITAQEKQTILSKIFQNSIMPVVYNFLYVLNLKKRLGAIFEIVAEFEQKLEKLNNILRINITSAIDLSEEKKEEIKVKISEKLNKNVLIEWNVNKDIIAGLIFKIDETIIDNSVRYKLVELERTMAKN